MEYFDDLSPKLDPDITKDELLSKFNNTVGKGYTEILEFLVQKSYEDHTIIDANEFKNDNELISYLGAYLNLALINRDKETIGIIKNVIITNKYRFTRGYFYLLFDNFIQYLCKNIEIMSKNLLFNIYLFLVSTFNNVEDSMVVFVYRLENNAKWLLKTIMLKYTHEQILHQVFEDIEQDFHGKCLSYSDISISEIKDYVKLIGVENHPVFIKWLDGK